MMTAGDKKRAKLKKKLISLIITVGLILAALPLFAAFEAHIINVQVYVEHALEVSPTSIDLGYLFPNEAIDPISSFTISMSQSFQQSERLQDIEYQILQKSKNHFQGTGEGNPYWDTHNMSNWLSKYKDPAEGEENDSNLNHTGVLDKAVQDISDTWSLDVNVPPIKGYVSQQDLGRTDILPEEGLYGCDLWIEVTALSYPGKNWTQTIQADFEQGVGSNVNTWTSPGDVILAESRETFTETFDTTTYKDAANTTANWSNGELKLPLGSGTWTSQTSNTTNDLYGVSALDPTHVWAVGYGGAIGFYNGASWTFQYRPNQAWLYDVSALDTTHVWASGQQGTMLFYNGSSWTPQPTGLLYDLGGVSAADPTHAWAVSYMEGIIFYNGASWAQQSTEKYFNDVFAVDPTHVWAVGFNGKIFFYNGTSWAAQVSGLPVTSELLSVSGVDPTHVWTSGYKWSPLNGIVLFYNDTSWSEQTSISTQWLNDVSAADATHVWAVGNNGTILFYNGTSWTSQTSGTTNILRGVFALDAGNAWAVGNGGKILKYTAQYPPSSTAQSTEIDSTEDNITSATLTPNHVLNGQTITYYLSANGGTNWEAVTPGIEHTFVLTGNDLRWKAVLFTTNPAVTPTIYDLTIDYHSGYASSGTLESCSYDSGYPNTNYRTISWNGMTPAGSAIKFQIATNNNNSTWNFVGPDGTSSTYYTTSTGQDIFSGHDGNRYVKYKAYLSTTNSSLTPTLSDVSITYAGI